MEIAKRHRNPLLVGLAAVLSLGSGLRADWRDDVGWTQLSQELGAAMPTGAGVAVLQAEANGGTGLSYMPQAGGSGVFPGAGVYAGKTFYAQDGASAASGHAASVASYFYANGSGLASGVSEIYGYSAAAYLLNRLQAVNGPEVFPGSIQNHSWIGSTGNSGVDLNLVRRFDFMLNRDGRVGVVGLNNGTGALPALMGNAYHGLVVGLRNGGHSRGGSNLDGSGRMKPDLVGNADYTSFSTPMVSGAATLLMQGAMNSGIEDGERPEVIKAILLAGASKQALPQWRRLSSVKPYDEVFGAGEVNIRHSWQIQSGGRWTASESAEAGRRGWDFGGSVGAGEGKRYFFSIEPGRFGNSFSAALTWHRQINLEAGTATLANLNLRLYAADDFTVGALLAESASGVDNVEHVFLRHLPPGQYALEVSSSLSGVGYGLAWQVVEGLGPQLTVSKSPAGEVIVGASDLDPWTTYQIQSSSSLRGGWGVEQTFRTGDGTASFGWSWKDANVGMPAKFYRLSWTLIR